MSDNVGVVIMCTIFFGWIVILSFGKAVSMIITAIADMKVKNTISKCYHELKYDECDLYSQEQHTNINVLVSVSCRKCGYHNSYNKFSNE